MNLIRFMLRTARTLFLLSMLCSILGGLATTALLVAINGVITRALFDQKAVLWFSLLVVAALAFRTAAALLLAHLGQSSLLHLRTRLSRQVLETPLRILEQLGLSSILGVLTDDLPAITNFVANVPVLCTNAAILLACLVYMGTLSLPLLGIVLLFLIVGILTYEYLMRVANHHIGLARKRGTALLEHFRSLLSGIKELKLNAARRRAFSRLSLESTATAYRRHMTDGLGIYAGATAWGELLMFMAIAMVLLVSLSGLSIPPRFNQPPSHLVAFILVLLYSVGPLESVINLLPQAGRASIALKSVNHLGLSLTAGDPVSAASMSASPSMLPQAIGLRGVCFDYGAGEKSEMFTLGPLTLEFPPGQLTFIVGGNGSGKSTFAKIITGLYVPASGELTIGGRSVDELSRESYRERFAAVFSDFHLFESLLGVDSQHLEESVTIRLVELQLSHKVALKDGGFSTVDLSQGQRKRLALLTACLEDRPFYLFDEWAADQDPAFKQIFYYQILPDLQRKGKTVFVITHDDRFFHVADRLIRLEDGRMVSDELVRMAVMVEPK